MENGKKPAYPAMDMNSYHGIDRLELRHEGLTKREVFAMAAMQGILANPSWKDQGNTPWIAGVAIVYADELLKQLES